MLLITMGDPNGIGPEILCRYLGEKKEIQIPIVIIGPESALNYFCSSLSLSPFWKGITSLSEASREGVYLYEVGNDFAPSPGKLTPEGGKIAGMCLERACELLKNNKRWALVTCPLNKRALMEAGYHFPGHTEFLADRFGLSCEDVCMHLCGERLRISLTTTHPPLREVPSLISTRRIIRCLELTWEMLSLLGADQLPIGVCGLNPHAGEGGRIGTEEQEIILPAIFTAREKGINAKGPYPGDTIFHRAYSGEFSAILAMYHDQGLAPLKLVHFNESVNVTLGLPVVRTSVDHGTAYELVGKGIASYRSLEKAIELAQRLMQARLKRD